MEKLSVIVPVYNGEQYLRECLDSIVNQTYTNLEIILVNDGSTDSSSRICHEYERMDTRVTVVDLEKNEGRISSRYKGLLLATADHVTFVDSDDWINKNRCQILMETLEKNGVDLVNTGCTMYWGEEDLKYRYAQLEEGLYDYKQIHLYILPHLWRDDILYWCLTPALWACVFKREMLLEEWQRLGKHHFDLHEDWAVVLPMLLKCKSIYISYDCSYYYRQRTRDAAVVYEVKNTYYAELLEWYNYMEEQFLPYDNKENALIKQLNLSYIHSVDARRQLYSANRYVVRYLFPFDKVEKGSNIVLYGAGEVGAAYYEQITKINYCRIVLQVDKNYQQYDGSLVKPVEALYHSEFDYVVIANSSKQSCTIIENNLYEQGVDKRKIIWGEIR